MRAESLPVILMYVSVLLTCVICANYIITVSQNPGSSTRISLIFTENQIKRFYQCMCQGSYEQCWATHRKDNTTVKKIDDRGQRGSNKLTCKYYNCNYVSSNHTLVCKQEPEERCSSSSYEQIVRIPGENCEGCVKFNWQYGDEKIQISSDGVVTTCKNNCVCPSTTTTTTTTRTTTTTTTTTTRTKYPTNSEAEEAAAVDEEIALPASTRIASRNSTERQSAATIGSISTIAPYTQTMDDNSQHSLTEEDNSSVIIGVVVSVAAIAVVVIVVVLLFLWRRKRSLPQKQATVVNGLENLAMPPPTTVTQPFSSETFNNNVLHGFSNNIADTHIYINNVSTSTLPHSSANTDCGMRKLSSTEFVYSKAGQIENDNSQKEIYKSSEGNEMNSNTATLYCPRVGHDLDETSANVKNVDSIAVDPNKYLNVGHIEKPGHFGESQLTRSAFPMHSDEDTIIKNMDVEDEYSKICENRSYKKFRDSFKETEPYQNETARDSVVSTGSHFGIGDESSPYQNAKAMNSVVTMNHHHDYQNLQSIPSSSTAVKGLDSQTEHSPKIVYHVAKHPDAQNLCLSEATQVYSRLRQEVKNLQNLYDTVDSHDRPQTVYNPNIVYNVAKNPDAQNESPGLSGASHLYSRLRQEVKNLQNPYNIQPHETDSSELYTTAPASSETAKSIKKSNQENDAVSETKDSIKVIDITPSSKHCSTSSLYDVAQLLE